MSKSQILFIGDLDESLPQFEQFKEHCEPLHYKLTTKEQFIKDIDSKFQSIQGVYSGWAGFVPIGGLTKDIIDHLPTSLKVIVSCAVGYDAFDTEALQVKGIRFYNTPSLGADHVADLVLWHVLESFRRFSGFQKITNELTNHTVKIRSALQSHGYDHEKGQLGTEQTEWERESYPFGHILGGQIIEGPGGKKVGLVGFGKIGQKIAKRLDALGMSISYYKRNELTKEESSSLGFNVEYIDKVDDLVSENDVVIICCPGNKSTLNLLNKQVLDKAKPNSKFINVGRGFIIDEEYLISKLEKGEIGFIGLDVFTGEPVINPKLINRSDVSLTPHIGSSTKDVFDNTAIFSLQNIIDTLEGKEGYSRIV